MNSMFNTVIFIILAILILGHLAREVLFSKKEKIIESEHEFLDGLWLWPKGSHTCWEANINTNGESIGIHAEDDVPIEEYREPTNSEILFCKNIVEGLETLYQNSFPAINEAWKDWGKGKKIPDDWRTEFELNGFSVPINGDINNYWGVTFYSITVEHYF